MRPVKHFRRIVTKSALAAATAVVLVTPMVPGSAVAAVGNDSSTGAATALPTGYGPLPAKPAPTAVPLPQRAGSVALNAGTHVRPGASDKAAAASADAVAPAVTGAKVALRALVLAVDGDDFGVPTWTSALGRVGAAYDVLYARTTPLTRDLLVRSNGVGKYNAILLTNGALLYEDGSGNYPSALTDAQWNILWTYERDFGVRQAVLYNSYGTWPEDYCLAAGSETSVGDTPMNATLTTAGRQFFDYLKTTAVIPITQSYVYSTTLVSGCSATPLLTSGSAVLGVTSTSTDGRERAELTFTSNEYLLQSSLLVYGLFRWASRGLFLGEQRHFLNVDVDDWFNGADHMYPDGHIESDPGFYMSAHDAYNAYLRQTALRTAYPLASNLKFAMAYNAGDAKANAANRCYPNGGTDRITETSRCLAAQFQWLNHTLTHPKMNFTDYNTNYTEITQNLTVGQQLGFGVNATVLKTGEYSGLGVYNPDPTNDIDPPTDYGLGASNTALLQAAKAAGVKYLHGNMSFASHQPSCFNCGIPHPLEPTLTIVPDWPTNIAYCSTTDQEEVTFFNLYYGPNGRFPYFDHNLTYAEILDYETGIGLTHMADGSLYTHTFHIANLRDYGSGKTLMTDWLDKLLTRYTSYFNVPVLSPAWPDLAKYAVARNGHFAAITAGADAVYDVTAKTVTLTSPAAGTVTVNGVASGVAGSTLYGTDRSAPITVTAGGSVTFSVTPRS